jgi:hypothetical protein
MAGMEWFFDSQGNCRGPVSNEGAVALISTGEITPATLVWCEDFEGWLPARETALFPPASIQAEVDPNQYASPRTNTDFPTLASASQDIGTPPPFRSVAKVVALSALTFGVYGLYLVYAWSHEVNAVLGRRKYRPALMVVLTVLTFGLAGIVLKIMWANDLQKLGALGHLPNRFSGLLGTVITLVGVSMIFGAMRSMWIGLVFTPAFSLLIAGLIQTELNEFSQPE